MSKSNWFVGGKVEVVVDGTPMDGTVLATHTTNSAAWIVEVEDFGAYEVVGGKVVRGLDEQEMAEMVMSRNNEV